MIRSFLILFLFFLAAALSAQEIIFDRPDSPGSIRTAQLRLKLSREYLFVIPGAGKPIRKLETMDLVLLTDIKVEKLNAKGHPVTLLLSPKILGGTLNGRRVDPAILKNRIIRAELENFPCNFSAADGKEHLKQEAITVLSALFRQQQNISYSEILGVSQKFQQGKKWIPAAEPILKNLAERKLPLNRKNLKAQAVFENKFKINGTECVSLVLNLTTFGTHAYDFQVKTRLILPVRKEDGGILRLAREGVEVIDRKTISGDFAAVGAALRITTKEQMEITYAPEKKENKRKSSVIFP